MVTKRYSVKYRTLGKKWIILLVLWEKDRSEVLDELKTVYTQSGKPQAKQQLENFLKKYKTKYPKIEGVFSIGESLFSYYSYPEEIRRSIYTSNLIENCNKGLKHKTKVK